ncbi:hypothetical protein JCM5350_003402 [Sporobolomyces pararoseus]
MSLDSPTTRLARSPPPTTPSLLASSLFDQTLSETRDRIKGKKKDRKGKGKHVVRTRGRRQSRSLASQSGDSGEDSEGNGDEDSSAAIHFDHPPSYPEAIEQQQQTPTTGRRTRTRIRSRSTSSISSSSENDNDENDALSNLLDLTTSLLTSSSEILSASKDLHCQLSRFLLSSSPPPSGSSTSPSTATNVLMNDVRSEIGLHGDNWDRLKRLERDVEKYGMKKDGKDPRSQLASTSRRSSHNAQPVVGIVTESTMRVLEEEGDIEEQENTEETAVEARRDHAVGLGRPPAQSSSTSVAPTSAIVRKGHLRRSSTAKDLLMQISSSSTTSSTPRSGPSVSPVISTPSSRYSSTSGETLESPNTPSRHRLSISPSLPSLSSSISTSSLSNSTSHPISPPYTSVSSSPNPVSHSPFSKSTPTRALSVSPSPSSILSLAISTSPVLESPTHPMSLSKSRTFSHSGPPQLSKSGSVAKVDAEDPLGLGQMLESSSDLVIGAAERRRSGGGGGSTAAADRLRTSLQGGISDSSARPTGGSWWGWR